MPTQTVYFATNRMPKLNAGKPVGFTADPGPVDGTSIRFGKIDVDVSDAAKDDKTVLMDTLHVAEELLATDDAEPNSPIKFGSAEIFDEIRKKMLEDGKNAGPIIAFIHGFNNGFEEAMGRAACLAAFYKDLNPLVFCFTWPSDGTSFIGVPVPIEGYLHDEEMAAKSGIAGARALVILRNYLAALAKSTQPSDDGAPVGAAFSRASVRRDVFCQAKIHLICHSMGNQVLSAIMRALPTVAGTRLRRVFDEVILAAADESADAFEKDDKLRRLPDFASRITVYHTREDWILSFLSEDTKNNDERLGKTGPTNMAPIPDKVTAIDVSGVVSQIENDIQGHQYYRKVAAVRDDIAEVLQGVPQDKIGNGRRTLVMPGRYRLEKRRRS